MDVIADIPLASAEPVAAGPADQPKYRIKNASHALGLIKKSKTRTQHHVQQDALVEDAYDRMPPTPPAELKAAQEEWRTNVDYGDTEVAINEKVEALVNMITQPLPPVDFNIFMSKRTPGLMDALFAVGVEYHFLLNQSDFYTSEVEKMAHNCVAHGLGIFYFPEPWSYHFRSEPRCNLHYPAGAGLNPDKFAWFAINNDILITDLIEKLSPRNRDSAEAMGWKLEKIKKLIAKQKNTESLGVGHPSPDSNPEGWIMALQDNDLKFAEDNNNVIKGYSFYVKEFDGKVTEHILVDDEEIGFIYSSKKRYDRASDFLILIPGSLGQGFIEKIRGLGHRLLPFHALINDLKNRGVDTTILSGSLMLKGKNEDTLQDVHNKLVLGGVVTMIPEDVSLDQRSFGNPAQGMIALEQSLRSYRDANNRVFGGNDRTGRETEMTATHAKLKYGEATRGQSFESDRFYSRLTLLHRALFKRLRYYYDEGDAAVACAGHEEVKAFWKEVKDYGVTKEDLDAIRSVSASSVFGDGDPNQVFMALQDLMALAYMMPVTAQRQMVKMMIAARTRKPHLAEEWMPSPRAGDRDRSSQLWRTASEHDAFENGSPMPLQDDDIDTIHAEQHTGWAEEVIQNYEQGILSPADGLKRLILVRDHTLGTEEVTGHMQRLKGYKQIQPLIAQLSTRWAGIANMMRRMEQQVKDSQAAEQERQMEEMRNPTVPVEIREKAMTEEFKRQQIEATGDHTRREISKTEEAKRVLMSQKTLTDQQLAVINSVPILGAEPNATPSNAA